jgi:hypothetical protein
MMNSLKTTAVLCLFFLTFCLTAETNLLKNGDFSKGMDSWQGGQMSFKTAGNKLITEVPPGSLPYSRTLAQRIPLLAGGKNYRLSFRLDCKEKGVFRAVYQIAGAPYTILGLVKNWELKPGTHFLEVIFTALPLHAGESVQLTFNYSRMSGEVSLSSVHLEELSLPRIPFAIGPKWKVFCGVKAPERFDQVPERMDGVTAQSVVMRKNGTDLRALNPKAYRPGNSVAVLYNSFHSPKEGMMRVGFSADWNYDIYFNGQHIVNAAGTKPFSPDNNVCDLAVRKGENLLVAVVRAGTGGWGFFCGAARDPIVFQEGKIWKRYQLTSPEVKAGSALDLSSQVDAPAGKSGRLIVSKKGELVFENEQNRPVRLLGFNGIKDIFEAKTNVEFQKLARRFAQAARRQGYRLFRVHSLLDYWLSTGSKEDMAINPVYLDRWDYLISELKKEGIYIHLVVFSFHLYTKAEAWTFNDRTLHKMMMYLDGKWEMDRFRYAVNTLFNHVNPYTGIAWKDDPVIAWVEYYNEQSLGLGDRLFSLIQKNATARGHLLKYWRDWLEKKYGKPMPNAKLPVTGRDKKADNDFALFWIERAAESARQCEKIIRATGYRGLVSNYTYSQSLGHSAARWETSQVTDVHAYFNHPSNWSNPGSLVQANSSIEAVTGYWRDSNSAKLAGRPFACGEFNHCFWNPYRYEVGLVFGGYSALQGYSALEIHERAVLLNSVRSDKLDCFTVGSSPVLRAAQYLTACLFQRGDVQSSPHRVSLIVPEDFLTRNANADKAVTSSQANLGLLAGYGLVFPGRKSMEGTVVRPESDLSLPVAGGAEIFSHDWFSAVKDSKNGTFSLVKTVAVMKQKGILSPSNISAPDQGIFQSDTEELVLNAPEKKMTVVTPRTEAVCMTAGKRESLKLLEVESSSADGCIALCSADRKPLAESRRIVLLYMTEEANSSMVLAANRATLIELGTTPILARVGILELNIRRTGHWKLYALGIDGSRREEIPVINTADGLKIHLDTGTLQYGPTPFFELVAE